jgi:hypothetical protein
LTYITNLFVAVLVPFLGLSAVVLTPVPGFRFLRGERGLGDMTRRGFEKATT